MQFHIPFTFAPLEVLKNRSMIFRPRSSNKKSNSSLQRYLENSDCGLVKEEYIAICIRGMIFTLLFSFMFSSTLLFVFSKKVTMPHSPFLYAILVSFLIATMVFFTQMAYPMFYTKQKQRNIDRNLIPALSDMIVQLSSGIPLFSILVNLSLSDYGALSGEFKKSVKKINAGFPEVDVLEEMGDKNASPFFRRALWQVSNGMRAGSDITIVIKESVKSLTEEQLLQVQEYGNKLNPLVMFYLMVSVIVPALSITFLTIISSLLSFPKTMVTLMFVSMFVMVTIIQVIFLGMLRSVRPSLL